MMQLHGGLSVETTTATTATTAYTAASIAASAAAPVIVHMQRSAIIIAERGPTHRHDAGVHDARRGGMLSYPRLSLNAEAT